MTRKVKYKKEYAEQIVDLMGQGLFDEEICGMWDITRQCFYGWLKDHPELKEGYDRGFNKAFMFWMGEGRKKFLEGTDGGAKYWNLIMTNKFHWNGKSHLAGDTQININNMNIIPQKTSQEYIEQIKDNLQELDFIDVKVIESERQDSSGTEGNS